MGFIFFDLIINIEDLIDLLNRYNIVWDENYFNKYESNNMDKNIIIILILNFSLITL